MSVRRPYGRRSLKSALSSASDLLNLVVADFYWGLPTEYRNQDLELRGVLVDLGDLAGEIRERAGDHLHRLADRELRPRARSLRGLAMHEAVDLGLAERYRLVARPDEAGHAGRVLDKRPCVVGHLHVHEHVAGHRAPLRLNLLAVLHLGDLLGRDDDLPDVRLLLHRRDPVLDVVLDLVLVARVGVDYVPAEHLENGLYEIAEEVVPQCEIEAG